MSHAEWMHSAGAGPLDVDTIPCRFRHLTNAVAHVTLTEGCIAFPGDREQDLCLHHLENATPLAEMTVVRWYPYDPRDQPVYQRG